MNISNLMGQYTQSASAGTEKLTGKKGVETNASSVKSLTKGNIFEGTVSSMKNGKVTLALANGTQISARLDGKVALTVGQSMFFQVKSNEGSQIAIRPFVSDSGGNITLMQALSAAGLPAEENYLAMVNKMMEEQMPIDRASLQQMARLVNANSGIDVTTIVQMQKLGIPITMENAVQFENYLGDKQAITDAFDELIQLLPEAMQGGGMSEEGLRQMNAGVLAIVTEGLAADGESAENLLLLTAAGLIAEEEAADAPVSAVSGQTAEGVEESLLQAAQSGAEASDILQSAPGEGGEPAVQGTPAAAAEAPAASGEVPVQEGEAAVNKPGAESDVRITLEAGETAEAKEHTLGAILDRGQLAELNERLGALVGQRTAYTPKQDAAALLNDLQQLLRSDYPLDRDSLRRLLASTPFRSLVRDALEQQWTIKPEDLSGSDQINRLYEKQNSQMNRMADVMKAAGQENATLARMVSDIRGNVDFMNQINQAYNYVQIPLKMAGQNASGELYVYTNKKALADKDGDLTAFLHLDMENLGPTDVSVRMRGRDVSTNFYLESDAAWTLVRKHLPILEAKLKSRGYNCTISVVNEEKHVNFVEDFLKKDQPSAGRLHRYSFDMRA